MAATVEHVVLFKAKDGADPANISAMVSSLRSLAALDGVLYLAVVPVLRPRSSAAAALGFTHVLHSRHASVNDLTVYSASHEHLSVVGEYVFPNTDDLMLVDWVGHPDSGPVVPTPGTLVRVTFVKLKEETGEEGKKEAIAALGEVGSAFPEIIKQISSGENMTLERAKGYTVASVALFASQEALDGAEAEGGNLTAVEEKVKHLVDSVIALDFLVQ